MLLATTTPLELDKKWCLNCVSVLVFGVKKMHLHPSGAFPSLTSHHLTSPPCQLFGEAPFLKATCGPPGVFWAFAVSSSSSRSPFCVTSHGVLRNPLDSCNMSGFLMMFLKEPSNWVSFRHCLKPNTHAYYISLHSQRLCWQSLNRLESLVPLLTPWTK